MASSATKRLPGQPEPDVRPRVSLEQRGISDMSLVSVWTNEDEQELVEIKEKLHQAHKKWSAEQELWHRRHEELEDLKRAWLKWEKKIAKAAKKNAERGQERNEPSRLGKAFRRLSGPLMPRRTHARTSSEPFGEDESSPLNRSRTNTSSITDIIPRGLGRLRSMSLGTKASDE